MTEKKFLSCVLVEGILLMALGLCMLLLPKLTSVTFGLIMGIAFVVYGGYKTFNAIMTRNYSRHFILNILVGLLLIAAGVLLFMAPMLSLVLITALIGIYFLFESISSAAFAIQTRNTLYYWWLALLLSIIQFLIGIAIIIGLPSTALWVVGILAGINFLLTGMIMIGMYISTKYSYN